MTTKANENFHIRKARMSDVDAIHELICYFAERHKMLFRTKDELYERIREFRVCYDMQNHIIGCCALSIMWLDLAEIRSLAVHPEHFGKGIGRLLVEDSLREAKELGIKKVFALTYETGFFQKIGFKIIDKSQLPHKVWTDCLRCPLRDNCNEIPVLAELG